MILALGPHRKCQHIVALLRGVNVGKGNGFPMSEFKLALEELGYTSVATLLNSGNAVFKSSARATGNHALAIGGVLTNTVRCDHAGHCQIGRRVFRNRVG